MPRLLDVLVGLAGVAGVAGVSPVATEQLVYDVEGRVQVPRHGEVRSSLRVRLVHLEGGVAQLTVDQGGVQRVVDQGSSEVDPERLHELPFYFHRSDAGEITRVLHHPEETVRELLRTPARRQTPAPPVDPARPPHPCQRSVARATLPDLASPCVRARPIRSAPP
jgi:hypothetical protein